MENNRQKEYFGVGTINELEGVLKSFGSTKVFLFTGKKSFSDSDIGLKINKVLQNFDVFRFSDFSTNPKVEDIERGLEEAKNFSPDVFLAVGGGSVIDMAKSVSILLENTGDIKDFVLGKAQLKGRVVPLIVIPTTSGSGSEATHFAAIGIGDTKYAIAHPTLLPDVVIVDPELTYSLPKKITAETGVDALCQAIESYWSINSTDESKSYAKKSMELSFSNLRHAVLDGDHLARVAMAEAAFLAGKAINISKTTACHAISYPLTSRFGIVHGHAVALTLSEVLLYNSMTKDDDASDVRGAEYVKSNIKEIFDILGAKDSQDVSEKLNSLFRDIGLEMSLVKLGVKKEDLSFIVENIGHERLKNNPRKINSENVIKILENILSRTK